MTKRVKSAFSNLLFHFIFFIQVLLFTYSDNVVALFPNTSESSLFLIVFLDDSSLLYLDEIATGT